MASAPDNPPTGRPDIFHRAVRASEDEGIQDTVPIRPGQGFRTEVERNEVGPPSDFDGSGLPRGCLRPPRTNPVKEGATHGLARSGHSRPGPVPEALTVFEQPKFFRQRDEHVGIRSDPERASRGSERVAGENPVTQVRLRHRTKSDRCAGACKGFQLLRTCLGAVNEAPALIDGIGTKQPRHRRRAEKRTDFGDLRLLFRNMNVDRAFRLQRNSRANAVFPHRTQRMRGNPEPCIRRQRAKRAGGSLHDLAKEIRSAGESQLTSRGLAPVAPAPLVEHRQECQADPGLGSRGRDPLRHLRRIAVGHAFRRVMQVVELRNRGIAGFQHFHLNKSGNRLDVLRGQDVDQTVHFLPPGPEVILTPGSAPLRSPRHRTLECVAVQVYRSGQQNAQDLPFALRTRRHGPDPAVVADLHGNVSLPTAGSERRFRPQTRDHRPALKSGFIPLAGFRMGMLRLDESLCVYIMKFSRPVQNISAAMNTVVIENVDIATMEERGAPYGLISAAAVVVTEEGTIQWCGPQADLPISCLKAPRINLEGRLLTPSLIDCHTHLVWAGNRAKEFEMRLEGRTYEEIARAGGGILSTVTETRKASDDELLNSALARARGLVAEGVSTIEIKSGYGLDIATELRMLRTARRIGEALPVRVHTSFLGAHAIPPEFAGRADAYIDEICIPALAAAHREGIVDAVDGFCEGIAFSPSQIERVFERSRVLGLPVKLHAEQLSNLGGARLAARFNALSADHLEYLDTDGAAAMAASGTVAVLLPGAFYTLRESCKPPVSLLREREIPIAVATDCNPGSSPVESLLLAMNMACILFELRPDEALAGVTRNAARALGIVDAGRIAPGLRADLAIWDAGHPAELVYRTGANPLHMRWFEGGQR